MNDDIHRAINIITKLLENDGVEVVSHEIDDACDVQQKFSCGLFAAMHIRSAAKDYGPTGAIFHDEGKIVIAWFAHNSSPLTILSTIAHEAGHWFTKSLTRDRDRDTIKHFIHELDAWLFADQIIEELVPGATLEQEYIQDKEVALFGYEDNCLPLPTIAKTGEIAMKKESTLSDVVIAFSLALVFTCCMFSAWLF